MSVQRTDCLLLQDLRRAACLTTAGLHWCRVGTSLGAGNGWQARCSAYVVLSCVPIIWTAAALVFLLPACQKVSACCTRLGSCPAVQCSCAGRFCPWTGAVTWLACCDRQQDARC